MKIGKNLVGPESRAESGRAVATGPDLGPDLGPDARDLARRQMQRERRRHLAKRPAMPDGEDLTAQVD